MSYKKKMKKAIRTEAAGRGLLVGAALSAGVMMIMWATGMNYNAAYPLGFTLVITLISAAAGVLLSLFRTSALAGRIRSLERISGDMDDDQIISLSPDTAMGEKWLVSHHGTKYRFWTKDMISALNITVNNPQAKKAVMEITDRRGVTEKIIVTRTDELLQRTSGWMNPETEDLL